VFASIQKVKELVGRMDAGELNRLFACLYYAVFCVMSGIMLAASFGYGIYTHIPLYCANIVAYAVGAAAAIRYQFAIEKRALVACVIFGAVLSALDIIVPDHFPVIWMPRSVPWDMACVIWYIYHCGAKEKQGRHKRSYSGYRERTDQYGESAVSGYQRSVFGYKNYE